MWVLVDLLIIAACIAAFIELRSRINEVKQLHSMDEKLDSTFIKGYELSKSLLEERVKRVEEQLKAAATEKTTITTEETKP